MNDDDSWPVRPLVGNCEQGQLMHVVSAEQSKLGRGGHLGEISSPVLTSRMPPACL